MNSSHLYNEWELPLSHSSENDPFCFPIAMFDTSYNDNNHKSDWVCCKPSIDFEGEQGNASRVERVGHPNATVM